MKFYEFGQNNSGGSFVVDDKLCHRVVIEADNAEVANQKAESLGIYFDGVSSGSDCECCGDRWYPCDEYDTIDDIDDLQNLADQYGWTTPDIRVFYSDGSVKEIFSSSVKAKK